MLRSATSTSPKAPSFLSFLSFDKDVDPSAPMEMRLQQLAMAMDEKLPKRGYFKH